MVCYSVVEGFGDMLVWMVFFGNGIVEVLDVECYVCLFYDEFDCFLFDFFVMLIFVDLDVQFWDGLFDVMNFYQVEEGFIVVLLNYEYVVCVVGLCMQLCLLDVIEIFFVCWRVLVYIVSQ